MQYFGSAVNMLVAIQLSFAIIAASLPDVRALIARKFSSFSPLCHRSVVTAVDRARPGVRHGDVEAGVSGDRTTGDSGDAMGRSKTRRALRKPDWLRHSIPASLMSTRVTRTRTELTRFVSGDMRQPNQRVEDSGRAGS